MNTITWTAEYSDGTVFPQYENGKEHAYKDIDRTKLMAFALYTKEGHHIITIHLSPDQRLIYRRRVQKTPGQEDIACYLAGWQETVNGRNVQSIVYVFENGQIHMAGEWDESHPWFYSPELLMFEQPHVLESVS